MASDKIKTKVRTHVRVQGRLQFYMDKFHTLNFDCFIIGASPVALKRTTTEIQFPYQEVVKILTDHFSKQ